MLNFPAKGRNAASAKSWCQAALKLFAEKANHPFTSFDIHCVLLKQVQKSFIILPTIEKPHNHNSFIKFIYFINHYVISDAYLTIAKGPQVLIPTKLIHHWHTL